MDDKKRTLGEAINNIKIEASGISITLSHAVSRLNELNNELNRLQAMFEGVEHQEDLLSQLDPEEALYAALYKKTNDHYDLYQPTLAAIVRDCVKNNGMIPESPQKKQAEYQCAGIIYFIEDAYKNLK
ncbi:hypothetical protein HNO52_18150 [Billgrantia diversa]|uniref:hypothetical protein n=1 Tax=Halomonas sp. MCCC 1A13316 TaxID=2733487 RepID=UPI0018A664F4|nr:hypothetical protein [Halomonas sp. MCCC 1A13316]QOR40227.1 hypothetical protein HNO52_18150 [Halomonas sp. MCCC 1A13316]